MLERIKRLANKIGIDGAIFYTILARVIQAGGGVISIFFIARYLNNVEQGYYYTFGSLLAIQIFFELGLSTIIVQFVAHEKANLTWVGKTRLVGDERALSRLASLLQFCVKWFAIITIILIFALLVSGYFFFMRYGEQDESVDWLAPWLILSIISGLALMFSPIYAMLEGLGKVKEVAKIRLVQQTAQLISLFSFLSLGFKLFSSPLAGCVSALIPMLYIFFSHNKKLLFNIWSELREWGVNYRVEIFPYQWRIALSWISGYFIFQLFNPVIFAKEGPAVAGQMGMTLAVLSGVMSISISWINTKVPFFSNLIAKKDFLKLDDIFRKTIFQASAICFLCLFFVIVGIYVLQHYNIPSGKRFLPITLVILLSAATFVNQIVSAMSTYLRCHKKEPLLVMSIALGVLTASSTFVLGHFKGVVGIVVGYSFITVFVSLLWTYNIFTKKRKEWHNQ